MYRNILLPQLKRAPWRTTLFLVLLAIATAFFCLSANLYQNSKNNIQASGDAYSTIAILEFIGNSKAAKEAAEQYGLPFYFSNEMLDVTDVSLQKLAQLPGVEHVDLRHRLAAYIPGSFAYTPKEESFFETNDPAHEYDLIRFKLSGDEPEVIDSVLDRDIQTEEYYTEKRVGIEVLWSASDVFEYERQYMLANFLKDTNRSKSSFAEMYPLQQAQLDAFNGNAQLKAGEIVLMPGVEYLASVRLSGTFSRTDTGRYHFYSDATHSAGILYFGFDTYGLDLQPYHETPKYVFSRPKEVAGAAQPIGLWRWDQVQNEPELLAYFETVEKAYQYSPYSFHVTTTDDLNGVYDFYTQEAFVSRGREFTPEEYQTGSRVCIVSRQMAEAQGWKVGDVLPMHFYNCDMCCEENRASHLFPTYTKRNDSFFDRGDYTIVGIWDAIDKNLGDALDAATTDLPWNTMFVPKASVQNRKADGSVSGSRLTIHLENGTMDAFLEAAEQVTFSEEAKEVRISAFDQGYSEAQDSLQSMLGTAQFLLALASTLLVVAGVLLAFFYTQSQKKNMALMRLLGCNRRQAGTMSLLGSLLILLPGGLLGMGAGHLLTDRVASAILNGTSRLDKPEYAGFREIFGVRAEVKFALAAQPTVSATALAIAAGLFLAGCLVFTLLLLRKEPREALQDK